MSDRHFIVFPPDISDRNGRRIRIGTRVTFVLDGAVRAGEVIAWGGPKRGLEVDLIAEPFTTAIQARDVDVVDEPHFSPVSIGWRVIEDDDRPVLLVIPLGQRDLQIEASLSASRPSREIGPPERGPRGEMQIRQWVADIQKVLDELNESADQFVAREFDMPMVRRVLDEAMLPNSVHRLVFVVTDQDHPQQGDTIGLFLLANHWLKGRGHLHDQESVERPILDLGEPIVIKRQPHLMDAVFYQIVEQIRARAEGCERVVTVLAGGTPGMMFGTILAASSVFSEHNVRIVQVPQFYEADGMFIEQPVIEFDLSDTILRKKIDPDSQNPRNFL